jgi:hypothetical protein
MDNKNKNGFLDLIVWSIIGLQGLGLIFDG